MLGKREPEIYGSLTFEMYLENLKKDYPSIELVYEQLTTKEPIDAIQKYGYEDVVIALNAGAYTHTSVAIADAIKAITAPVISAYF